MHSLKKGEEVPLLNFVGGPGVPLLNFEGGPGVPLLNFRGVPGPTFKLWGRSQVPSPKVLRSRAPGSWSQFYTMPKTKISKETLVYILSIISASIKFIYSSKYFNRRSMWYKIEKICLPCVHFTICLVISLSQVMGGLVLMHKRISFLQVLSLFFCW